jgi:hypothetical protein
MNANFGYDCVFELPYSIVAIHLIANIKYHDKIPEVMSSEPMMQQNIIAKQIDSNQIGVCKRWMRLNIFIF